MFRMIVLLLPMLGVAGSSPSWPAHPRLRLDAVGLTRLKAAAAADPLAQQLLSNLRAHVEYVLSQPVPSGADLLNSLQQDIYPLGLLYRLSANSTQRGRLARRAADELLAVAELDGWSQHTELGDVRFLTIAEAMQGVAIGYDWFYADLSSAQRRAIEDGLYRNGLSAGMRCYSYNCKWVPGVESVGNCSSCWWTKAGHMNWNVVCNGGVTIAALALADVPRYAEIARQALQHAAQGVPLAISGYGPAGNNGAWPEGPGYWVYTTKWLLAMTETMLTAIGHDNGYMSTPGISQTAGYALQMYQTPSRLMFNYGDSADGSTDPNVASNLLGLAARFAGTPTAAAAAHVARAALRTGNDGTWDVAVLALMRWQPARAEQPELPHAAFYDAQAVAVVRSGWDTDSAYLSTRGGNSTVTHQDVDHGTFVWETRGYRWAVDLGTENYGLPNMFLPFEGRYRYYRKSTRGHNTLAFRERGGFDPADAELSDQAVNAYSPLSPGSACTRTAAGAISCGSGQVAVINLTQAYAPQLPDGRPDPNAPLAARALVSRAFQLNAAMSELVVVDSISNSADNVTWAMHTRAQSVAVSGSNATLTADLQRGLQLLMTLESTPADMCSGWQSAIVKLPNGTSHNQTRFPLNGAKKVWAVCAAGVEELKVTLKDL